MGRRHGHGLRAYDANITHRIESITFYLNLLQLTATGRAGALFNLGFRLPASACDGLRRPHPAPGISRQSSGPPRPERVVPMMRWRIVCARSHPSAAWPGPWRQRGARARSRESPGVTHVWSSKYSRSRRPQGAHGHRPGATRGGPDSTRRHCPPRCAAANSEPETRLPRRRHGQGDALTCPRAVGHRSRRRGTRSSPWGGGHGPGAACSPAAGW